MREERLLERIRAWRKEPGRRTGQDSKRAVGSVLGHLQRGGSPTTFDRLLALRFGATAVRLAQAEEFDHMVGLDGIDMISVPLADAIKGRKKVPLDSDKILTANEIGICFGD